MQDIGLAEALAALRQEFARAVIEGEDSAVQFPVGQVTLEFQVGVTRSGEGKAGIQFWVIELGASGKYSAESMQKVTVKLEPPVDRLGQGIRVVGDMQEKPG
jgi:hypothetical protein